MTLIFTQIPYKNDDDEITGSIEGYVVNKNDENWKNYLKTEVSQNLQNFLIPLIEKSSLNTIAIIKDLHVDEEYRGQGIGNDLMSDFLAETNAEIVMLVADTAQTQNQGFVLVKWYEGFGFENLDSDSSTTFMIFDEYGTLSKEVDKPLKGDYDNYLNSLDDSNLKSHTKIKI